MFQGFPRTIAELPPLFRQRGRTRRRMAALRPVIEGMEDRTLLSTITWNTSVAPSGGDWDTASNWVGGVVPTASSNAVINLTSSGTVTHSTSANDAVLSLMTNSSTTVSLASGSIAIGAATSTIAGPLNVSGSGTLQLSGTTLNGSGALTDAGGLIATNSTFAGGQVTFGTGNTLSSGNLTNNIFNTTVSAPAAEISLLTNNASFEAIDIAAGSLNSGTVALNLIGSSTNQSYVFGGRASPVQSGATLNVGSGVNSLLISAKTAIDH